MGEPVKVRFLSRQFIATNASLPVGMTASVKRMSWHYLGGPEDAEISVSGGEHNLMDLRDLLRCMVEVYDDNGAAVWWGYVHRIEIPRGEVCLVLDLEQMANRLKVAYTLVQQGDNSMGTRADTPWYEQAYSIERFGIKELIESGTDMNMVAANAMGQRKLSEMAWPTEYVDSNSLKEARLFCQGYWQSLGWRYAPVPTQLIQAFETIGGGRLAVQGDVRAAQSFDVVGNINLREIGVYVRKVGSPGDLTLSICENADDPDTPDVNEFDTVPGTSLSSVTVSGLLIGADWAWVKGTLSANYGLEKGKSYWLQVNASAGDANNYYEFATDTNQGYGAGVMVVYRNNVWTGEGADMPFRLYTDLLVETTVQIQSLINAYGQFLRHVRVEAASGITSESYRSGDTTALTEIEAHLETGTSDYKRLIARVNRDRTVDIIKQQDKTSYQIEMHDDGKLYTLTGAPLDLSNNPVGKWVSTRPISMSANPSGGYAMAEAMFVDRVEWDDSGRIRLTPANWRNPYAVRAQNG